MRYRYIWFALISSILIFGCTSMVQVDTDYDPEHDFANYRSYAWHDKVVAPGQVVEKRIRHAIEAAFIAQGYSRVASGNAADFLVSFTAVAEQAIRPDTISTGMGYRQRGWGSGTSTYSGFREYTRGTLIIDIIEPDSKSLLWRGVSSAALYPSSSEEEKNQLVNETVTAILDKFPPGSN
jgi:hypothetical protein